ncbi:MAG: alpha/beta hydrolase [Myxococcales bacterium]|nr:alpha/beta hydrolase [Myxococcales bacterium]
MTHTCRSFIALLSLTLLFAGGCGSSDAQSNPTSGSAATDAGTSDAATADATRAGEDVGGADGASVAADGGTYADAASDASQGGTPVVTASAKLSVKKTSAVVYGKAVINSDWGKKPGKETDLLLDIYAPTEKSATLRPAIIFIHGGGFVAGTRHHTALVAQANYFAARGWFTVSIDYRLAYAKGTVPEKWGKAADAVGAGQIGRAMYMAVRDAKAAVRWLHANAEKYGVDPNHIAIGGGSAGAYTAVGVGVTNPEDFRDELTTKQDPTLPSTHLDSSSKVACIIDYWGAGTIAEFAQTFGGKSRFDAADPPVAIIHGTQDKTVSFAEAGKLKNHYEKTGAAFAYHPLEGAGHSAWQAKVGGKSLSELAFDFIVVQQKLTVLK